MEIHYHPGKANVVADALSHKSYLNATMASQMPQELYKEFQQLNLGFIAHTECITIEVEPISNKIYGRVSLKMLRFKR
jgi:hypothetical protein